MRKALLFISAIIFIISCSTTENARSVNDADMVLEIADIYNRSGESEAERKVLEGYVKEHGYDDSRVNYNLLLFYFKNSEYNKVIGITERLLEKSDDVNYMRLLALSLDNTGESERAADVYLGIVKSDSAIEDDYLKASAIALKIDDKALALGILKIGIEDRFLLTKDLLAAAISIDDNLKEYKIILENIL